MKNIKMTLATCLVSVSLLCSCGHQAQLPLDASNAPNLSTNEMTQTGGQADPKSYAVNNPFILDLNGDGTNDSVILYDNVLTWKRSQQGGDVALLKVGFPFHAYTLKVPPDRQRFALYIYDEKDLEHYSENLGNEPDGTPRFGPLESK